MLTTNKSNKDYCEAFVFNDRIHDSTKKKGKWRNINSPFLFQHKTKVAKTTPETESEENREEISRRKVHYITFGYSKRNNIIHSWCLSASCTNRIDSTYMVNVYFMLCFPLQMATRRMLYSCIIYFVYTAIAFNHAHNLPHFVYRFASTESTRVTKK